MFPEKNVLRLPENIRRIHERGKLRVAMYAGDRFPYFFAGEDGKLSGSDVEMAYRIAYQLGVKEIEFDRTAGSFDELIEIVNQGSVDMAISKISITLNRAQLVLYSDPYLQLKQAVLLNRIRFADLKAGSDKPLLSLAAHPIRLGAIKGTSYVEFAKRAFPKADIVPYPDFPGLLEAVEKGEIVAAFYDEFEFKQALNEHPEALIDLQLLIMEDRKDDLAIALPPGSGNLQQWVNLFLRDLPPIDMDQVLQQYARASSETK